MATTNEAHDDVVDAEIADHPDPVTNRLLLAAEQVRVSLHTYRAAEYPANLGERTAALADVLGKLQQVADRLARESAPLVDRTDIYADNLAPAGKTAVVLADEARDQLELLASGIDLNRRDADMAHNLLARIGVMDVTP